MDNKVNKFEKRIHEVDFLRGILILLVCMDHLFVIINTYSYDWYTLTGNMFFYNCHNFVSDYFYTIKLREPIRFCVIALFCFLSGISTKFSRDHKKRTIQLIGLWLGLYAILAIADAILSKTNILPGQHISLEFNIIGVLAVSHLLYSFFEKKSNNVIIIISLILLVLSLFVIPYITEEYASARIHFPLIWEPKNNCDWLPLFPYILFFFFGILFSRVFYKNNESLLPRRNFERPICFIGRNTIFIYLGIEIVYYMIFIPIDLIIRGIF